LVGAYDGAAGVGYIYLNGTQVKSNSVSGLAQNMAATFNIADRGDGAPFAGEVDEVAVYSGVLSISRIQAHYAAAAATQAPKITVTKSGDTISLSWPKGVLYQSDSVNGQYSLVSGAGTSYQVTATNGAKFYLLRTQ